MKAAVQILKKAEELKRKVTSDTLNDNEAWNSHQQLQDIYQQLLVIDLEYALDKKVEQDLWNYVFKNQINALQLQTKDRKNPKRSESQENLVWFLESASGFYLQLLQELCETFELDIPCRRKGPVFGVSREIKPLHSDIAPPHKSSCLYICQHCLVHLGDIARYRNQSLQAETFYRHAAELVPSNGQPYNQLAILEAAKGDKLSTVFYYVRSIAVKYPFPVASTNLQKMFSKIANDEFQHEGKSKLSVYDYVTAFLQFHALVHLTSDLGKAQKLGKVLASNLTVLVATESITAWKLIQMTAINLFAIAHATRTLESSFVDKKEEEPEALSEDEQTSYNLVLELIASTLNGLLLLVYTMKEDSDLKAYYALPVVKLILEWLRQDPSHLKAAPFTSKLQIWPSFCKLLNAIQTTQASGFDINKYVEVPLPEDWDLQSFLPLHEVYQHYKFKECLPHFSNEVEHTLRTIRLVTLGHWLCEQEIYGVKLMVVLPAKDDLLLFEAITPQTPSSDVLKQLEDISLGRSTDGASAVSIVSSNGKHNGAVNTNESPNTKLENGDYISCVASDETATYLTGEVGIGEHNGKGPSSGKIGKTRNEVVDHVLSDKNVSPSKDNSTRSALCNQGRERKTRQNVALQTIMQRKNMILKPDTSEELSSSGKPKSEGKQVTFKTPSPSPPASSGGTPPLPQITSSTPSPIFHIEMAPSFAPLHGHSYGSQQKLKNFGNLSNHTLGIEQNMTGNGLTGVVSNMPPSRTLYPSLPNSDTNFTVNSSNKFGYFANVENRPYLSVGSTLPPQQLLGAGLGQRVGQAGAHLPSQNKDVLGTVGGNAPQHNSRLGLMGVNSSSVVNVGTSNNGSIGGNVLGVTQPQHNLMFGHSLTGNMGAQQLHGPQQHTANVNPASSGPIQSLGPQNRVALSQAAITAVKKQQRQTMPPYAVNSALFGQSSQPAWFPSPQNNIGVPPSPAKPTGFDQMFPQLNPSQAPPPLHQVGQLFTNQLMPNQPFGTTQRPHFPHSDQNPFIYQMMSQISDQHSFPNFSASGISQPTPLHSQNSGSVSLSSVPSQSQISGNLVHVHQIPSNFVHQSITSLDGVSSNFQEKQQHLSPVAHPYDELKSQHIGGTSRVLRNEHQSMNSNSAVPQPPSENMGLVYPNTDNSTKPHHSVADGCGSSNDNMPSTYSLFNSPWSSGLNLSNSASRDDSNPQFTNSNDFGGFLHSEGLQSLWSGPGPSPLERLLEQQKQKKDPAPH